jgi:hypothetical protein
MIAKRLVTLGLLLFIAAGVGTFLVREFASPPATAKGPLSVAEPVAEPSGLSDEPTALAPSDPGIQTASSREIEESTSPPPTQEPRHWVLASYFHNTVRCETCLAIEHDSHEILQAAFGADFASGKLVWRSVNMEDKANRHYVIDYQLPCPSLVIAEMEGECELRFKLLGETWNLIHGDSERFNAYVISEVWAWLKEIR